MPKKQKRLNRIRKSKTGALCTALISLMLCGCYAPRTAKNTHKIIVIIDDAGPNFNQIEPFLNIPAPLTIAVLPDYSYTEKTAENITLHHPDKELILHQPMEPVDPAIDPGSGTIWVDTPKEKILNILTTNIMQVANAKGMNNHMGSLVTQNRDVMETVITFCKTNDLYFIDSFTTPDSVAGIIAHQQGVPSTQQHVFLDNDRDPYVIREQFIKGMHIAEKKGYVVMIGHAWSPETASIINQMVPIAKKHAFSFHTASTLFKRKQRPLPVSKAD